MIDQNKELVQHEALLAWKEADYWGTIIMGTGSGKTKVGVEAIEAAYKCRTWDLHPPSILIVVPTTNLRENEWPSELRRWLQDTEILSYVTIECIQTVYKDNKYKNYDIVIVDEIHTILSEEYSKFLDNNNCTCFLGLTATLPHNEDHLNKLTEYAPVVYQLSMNESKDLNLISDFKIYNYGVQFTRSERAKHRIYTNWLNTSRDELMRGRRLHSLIENNAFELAQKYSKITGHPLQKVSKKFWLAMSMRRWLCYRAERKIDTCIQIIQERPTRKWIIFCHDIKMVEEVTMRLLSKGIFAVAYHSKQKKVVREQALITASSSFCRVIVSAQALNTGYNLPSIDGGIALSSTSVELTAIQELGRISRKYTDKPIALFINLYAKDSQEQSWVESKNINLSSVINLDNLNLIPY